jgi:hypothetical protein
MYLIIFDEEGHIYIHNKSDLRAAKAHANKLHSSVDWRIVKNVSVEMV